MADTARVRHPRAVWLACDAVDFYGARYSGLSGGGVWADFPTRAGAEQFALVCVLQGFGVYLSRTFADRNRVVVNPDWRP